MIKLMELNDYSIGTATFFADTKVEVPATAAAPRAAAVGIPNYSWLAQEGNNPQAGSIIWTGSGEVASVLSNGNINWWG